MAKIEAISGQFLMNDTDSVPLLISASVVFFLTMNIGTSIFIIVSLFVFSSAGVLKFVTVVHRHGDRLPNYIYPSDPYSSSVWKNRTGQLINAGKNRSYHFGKFIRERYKDFLPLKYDEEDVYVLSSDKSRTLMTAYCVLAGLYEPQGDDVWLESIKWQPIPVHSLPIKDDNLLRKKVPCPKHNQLLNDHGFMPNSEKIDKYKEIVKELTVYSGYPMPNDTMSILKIGSKVYDCLDKEEQRGLKLPEWTKKFYPEPLRTITVFKFSVYCYDTQLRRLRCGPLLKDIIQHLEEVKDGILNVKFWQYSAHDTTVLEMLQCMDVYDGDLVPYLGAIFFELYETGNDFELRIYYKKKEEIKELQIPGCPSPCSLDLFKKLMRDVIPDNWEEECKL